MADHTLLKDMPCKASQEHVAEGGIVGAFSNRFCHTGKKWS